MVSPISGVSGAVIRQPDTSSLPRAPHLTISAEDVGVLINKLFDRIMEGRAPNNRREYREVPSPEMRAFMICRALSALGFPVKLKAFERQVDFNTQNAQRSSSKQIAWVIAVRRHVFNERGEMDWKQPFNMQLRWMHDTVSIKNASSWSPCPQMIVEYLGGGLDGIGVTGIERWGDVETSLFAEGQAYLIRKGSRPVAPNNDATGARL